MSLKENTQALFAEQLSATLPVTSFRRRAAST